MRWIVAIAIALVWPLTLVGGSGAAAPDPLCLGQYGGAPAGTGAPLRFGVDPGIAGSAGTVQLPSVCEYPVRDLSALRALRPARRMLVLRLNRLFWSARQAGINGFRHTVAIDTRAGFEVELQVPTTPRPARRAGSRPGTPTSAMWSTASGPIRGSSR